MRWRMSIKYAIIYVAAPNVSHTHALNLLYASYAEKRIYNNFFSIFYSDEHNGGGGDECNDSGDCPPLPANMNIPPIRTLLYANTDFII